MGTFGLSCASYWWTRIAACGLKLTYHLLGPGFPLDMLLYADDLESMGRGAKGRRGIPLSYPATRLVFCGSGEVRPSHATDHDPGRLQKPELLLEGAAPLSFFTDAKAEDGRAWIGGFLELVDGCQGPWFSLEVTPECPWAFAPGKVIAALELLATLVGVRLWVPEGNAKKTSRVATPTTSRTRRYCGKL